MSVNFISLFTYDPTVTDLKNPVKSFYHAMIVGDDKNGRVVFYGESFQKRHDVFAVFRVEGSSRLIGKYYLS